MHHSDYVPLHLHTEYSLLDGAIKIDELVAEAGKLKMPAVAMTDHGNLFGAVEFYEKATKAGIHPIMGCEVYVAPKSRLDKERTMDETAFHLVLLARDNNGYKNLLNLVTRAYTEGFYYKPRIDMELLEQYSGGLIGLSACLKGEVPWYLGRDMLDKARDLALRYKHILGPENFFLEVQNNGMKEQQRLNKKLIALARELHIGLVATNDCHYLRKEDALAHEVLLCIQTGKTMSDPRRMRFETDGFYFKNQDEMKAAFAEIPEAVLNTRAVAERCNVQLTLGESLLPRFEPPNGAKPFDYLEGLAAEGMRQRFGPEPPEAYRERLKMELSVIKRMGYASYFLIVHDFVTYAKEHGIPVGPGRGSAAGSLASYALGITEIDPLKYNLLFERFLNPERLSMPDMDIDFCKDKRPEVISYVSEKYGSDHVAQIITFGTMAAKAAIRDVGRAMDVPYSEADKLAKLVPDGLKVSIDRALKEEPRLKELYDTDPKVKEHIDIAKRLEGLSRHASTHAAGVVISPTPLTDITPLYKNPSDQSITTQFDMGSIEKIGLVKFDFLGLKTLTVLDKTIKYIAEGEAGEKFSLSDMPLDDKKTFELLSSGRSTGIFQLESSGMRDILIKMKPDRFEDLIALVALYRPGPIGSGMIDDFIKRKRGKTAVKYELPQLKGILDETYGVILYQEQVMSIANKLAGFSLGRADALRKAMGKKLPEEMEKHKEDFIAGAVKNKISEKKAARLFDLMAMFAEYGFNKSHSAAYAYLAYQTAYLKAHYPLQFMAANLSSDLDSTEKIVKSIKGCRNMSIDILPPDINQCGLEFKVAGTAIRFGLGAVKGVGAAAIESILSAREAGPFPSLEEFLRRVDNRKINKKVNEALIKSGAFDSLFKEEADGGKPLDLAGIGRLRARAMDQLESSQGEAPSLDLFASDGQGSAADRAWDEAETLRHEKDAIGVCISGNPLTKYKSVLASMHVLGTSALEDVGDREEVEVAGIIGSIRKIRIKGNTEMMAYLNLEDDEGGVEVIVFPELLRNNAELIIKDAPVLVKGSADRTEKGVKIKAWEISGLDERMKQVPDANKLEIFLKSSIKQGNGYDIEKLSALRELMQQNAGPTPAYFRLSTQSAEVVVQTAYKVKAEDALVEKIEDCLGVKGSVRVI